MKKIFMLFIMLFFITFVSAPNVGISDMTKGKVVYTPPVRINYSIIQTNQSNYWGGHFYTDYDLLVPYTGADTTVNLGSEDLTTTGQGTFKNLILGGVGLGTTQALKIVGEDDENSYVLEIGGASGGDDNVMIRTGIGNARLTVMAGVATERAPRLAMNGANDPSFPGFLVFDYGAQDTVLNSAEFRMRYMQGTGEGNIHDMIRALTDQYVMFTDSNEDTLLYVDTANDRVGVKTETPGSDFEVNGTSLVRDITTGTNDLLKLQYENAVGSGGYIWFGGASEYGRIESYIDAGGEASMRFYDYESGALTEAMRLDGGNATFEKDVIIKGTLFGGSPVKIAGINIFKNSFMLEENLNGSSRFTLKNINESTNATAAISAINDVGGIMSIGIGSSNFMIGNTDYKNVTALFSKSRGDMVFANFFKEVFRWFYNPSDDNDPNNLVELMRLDESGLNVFGNIISNNSFVPQYIFVHNNATMVLASANVWENVTFDQEVAEIKEGISHTFNDNTNHTFTINQEGIYDIDFNFDAIDTSGSSTDIDVAGRIIYSNGTEITGSVFETDITKKNIEVEIAHSFLAKFYVGDKVVFQFTATDVDVDISTHGTFGDHPDSATIRIEKIANI